MPECDSLAGGVVDGVIGREPEPQFDKVRTGKSHAVLAGVDSLTVGGSGIVIGRVGVGVLFSAKARVCDDQGVALAQVGRLGDLDFRSSYGVGLDGDRCRFSSLDIKGNGIPGEFSVILGEFPAEPIIKVVNIFRGKKTGYHRSFCCVRSRYRGSVGRRLEYFQHDRRG